VRPGQIIVFYWISTALRKWVLCADYPNRASGLALKPLRACGFSADQQYGQKSVIWWFFFGTPIFRILVQIAEKYFTVYMEFTL
jgi:hypothetical protein